MKKNHSVAKKMFSPIWLKSEVDYLDLYLLAALFILPFAVHWTLALLVILIIWIVYEIAEYFEILRYRRDNLLEFLFDAKFSGVDITLEKYIQKIESGAWERKMVLGVSDKEQDFLVRDPNDTPGALGVGGMGSGKTTWGLFTVGTSFMTSSHLAFFLFVDVSDKGAADYSTFFKYKKNAATALYEKAKLVPVFMFLYAELLARSERFKNMDAANSVPTYEERYRAYAKKYQDLYAELLKGKKLNQDDRDLLDKISKVDLLIMPPSFNVALKKICNGDTSEETLKEALYDKVFKGVAQINVIIEEFHAIPSSKEMDYFENASTPGTIANMFQQLARTSRSSGFNFILITQRLLSNEVPSDIKTATATTLCHKVNNPGDAAMANLPHAETIKGVIHKGRAAYEDGFSQAPLFSRGTLDKLVEKYYKPLEGELFAYSVEDYHRALGGTGSDGMCDTMPLKFVVKNSAMFNHRRIVSRILSLYNVEEVPWDLTSLEVSLVAEKDGVRYAILAHKRETKGYGSGISSERIRTFIQEAHGVIKADKFIIFNFDSSDGSIPKDKDILGFNLGPEAMEKIGEVFDNKDKTVANGSFDTLFNNIPLTAFINGSTGSDDASEQESDDDFFNQFQHSRRKSSN